VRGDRDRLEQALQNLAANALRYTPPGSEIELRARPLDRGVAFSVTDHGPGIAPEHLPYVFDRFYKVEESRVSQHGGAPVSHGSGLGLSIVKAIVERHGGQITAHSRPGHTVFEFVIPS
jgi:two-component system heavy metal sensor histidine kinase CusS